MGFNDFFDEEKFDFEAERKKFIDNLDFLKSMSVQEQTLYKKWMEFNADVYSMTQKATHFSKIENLFGCLQISIIKNKPLKR